MLATAKELNGGGDRTRTRYLLLAKQPLSQLSYTPKTRRTLDDNGGSGWSRTNDPRLIKTVL